MYIFAPLLLFDKSDHDDIEKNWTMLILVLLEILSVFHLNFYILSSNSSIVCLKWSLHFEQKFYVVVISRRMFDFKGVILIKTTCYY